MKYTKQGQAIYDNGMATHLINGKEVTRHEYCVCEKDGSSHYIYDDAIKNYELVEDPLKNINTFEECFAL